MDAGAVLEDSLYSVGKTRFKIQGNAPSEWGIHLKRKSCLT